MKKNLKAAILLLTVSTTTIVTGIFLSFLAENYFFDRLLYQKSPLHGYGSRKNIINKLITIKRTKYVDKVYKYLIDQNKEIPLSPQNEKERFTILIIGDSYTYGYGVRLSKTYPEILKKKLQKLHSVDVINISSPGDNLFHHFIKYQAGIKLWNPDLVIFALTDNDLLWGFEDRYPNYLFNSMELICHGKFYSHYRLENDDQWSLYRKSIEQSLQPNSGNICAFTLLTQWLPQENTIYLYIDSLLEPNSISSNNMMATLEQKGFEILDLWSQELEELFPNKFADMRVSNREGHLNSTVHDYISEKLFDYIYNNHMQR